MPGSIVDLQGLVQVKRDGECGDDEGDVLDTYDNMDVLFVDPPTVAYLTITCDEDEELLAANRELQLETRQLVQEQVLQRFFLGGFTWKMGVQLLQRLDLI